eukprot:jgi/Tetstr1/446167/TSEL_003568.t1
MEKEHMVPVPGSALRDSRQAAGEPQSAPPDLLELAQSGRVGVKSVSDEDDYLALHVADVDEDVAVVDAGVAAKVSTSDGVGRLSSELLEVCEATFR